MFKKGNKENVSTYIFRFIFCSPFLPRRGCEFLPDAFYKGPVGENCWGS